MGRAAVGFSFVLLAHSTPVSRSRKATVTPGHPTGLGVTSETLKVPKVDHDYFEED